MRTDPRAACTNEKELLFWAVVHDLICHSLMALTLYSRWSIRFHDWTSCKAWPRNVPTSATAQSLILRSRYGRVVLSEIRPGLWRVGHPKIRHAYVTQSDDAVQALEFAEKWFDSLAQEFSEAEYQPEG